MSAILSQEQKILTKPNIYARLINIWMSISKESLVNNKRFLKCSRVLYFKCPNDHITPCNTPRHQLFYCEKCKQLYKKKLCLKYSDTVPTSTKYHQRVIDRYKGKPLYLIPANSRLYRKRKKADTWPEYVPVMSRLGSHFRYNI
jgi:hypothetical protein